MPVKPTIPRAKQSGKGHRKAADSVKAKAAAKPAYLEARLAGEYLKYFTAPQATPGGFYVYDLTDGGSVTTSSHT